MDSFFDLSSLWPDFQVLFTNGVNTGQGLSAAVVAIMIAIVIVAVTISLYKWVISNKQISFYFRLIQGVTVDDLAEKRRDIRNRALENTRCGYLWREFDESLVFDQKRDRLCNTLDAAHFFNTHTISRGLTENRLIAAVPGFLTAIGVIGTFVGLQLGLSSLGHLDPATAKADELTTGIFGMIGGASIAFMTSVWGVVFSLLFNFFEKLLERHIRNRISKLQNDIDYLYPRLTAEQSLSNIEDYSRQSKESLAELDEKIGGKLQEAMREASGAISQSVADSLERVLGPAIAQLVDNANSGSQEALKSLLDRFMAGVGDAGNSQREMLNRAAEDMSNVSGSLTKGLESFTQKLEGQIGDIAKTNADVMESVKTALSGQIADQQSREVARQKILHDQLKSFQTSQESISDSISGVLQSQKAQSDDLASSMSNLIDRLEALSGSHESATQAMQSASSEMRSSANQLGLLSANLKDTLTDLANKLNDAINNAEQLTSNNESVAESLGVVGMELKSAGETMKSASESLNSAAQTADSGLSSVNRHFNDLGESLKQHIEQVEAQVANLLSEYSQRVQNQTSDRMDHWNVQTNSYVTAMTDAINLLSGVVDDIEGKVSSRSEARLS